MRVLSCCVIAGFVFDVIVAFVVYCCLWFMVLLIVPVLVFIGFVDSVFC